MWLRHQLGRRGFCRLFEGRARLGRDCHVLCFVCLGQPLVCQLKVDSGLQVVHLPRAQWSCELSVLGVRGCALHAGVSCVLCWSLCLLAAGLFVVSACTRQQHQLLLCSWLRQQVCCVATPSQLLTAAWQPVWG